MATVPTLTPPKHRLHYFKPLQDITIDKKYKLTVSLDCFLFFINKNLLYIPFLQIDSNIINIKSLLKRYTNTNDIIEQFNILLGDPLLINDARYTNCIIEVMYVLSQLYKLDLKGCNNLEELITYYNSKL
jgi:hypothetical protein